ncbi:rhomboid family intramembrane serine protease [Pseudogracilibacillus sp. ICA-222130]|uniref:rhomboid family intramembrane serine protease n=1 Tax=Pseudogracilibacillus sp. ICA-222130 TaxID=3134655 RepID=UPI0030BEE99D
MSITNQYFMYHTLFELVKNEQYEMVHINIKRNEAWVQKKERGKTTVIRFLLKQFDWQNHVKKDIATVFKRITSMRRIFRTKKIDIYNVYIADKKPIDATDPLPTPIVTTQNQKIKMNVYYITDTNEFDEKRRFLHDVNTEPFQFDVNDFSLLQYKVRIYKMYLQRQIYEKNKEIRDVFTYGKPFLTYIFLLLNLCVFLFIENNGGSMNQDVLIKYGAKYNEAILEGEWWRLFTAAFIHIGFIHFFINMLALYYIGQFVERIYGSKSFFIIYFLALFLGNMASFVFTDAISAGASGGIFGLFGALLYFGTKYRELFIRTIGNQFMFLLIVNIILGIIVPQIDIGAHIGGLIGGFLAAMMATLPYKKSVRLQIVSFSLYVLIALCMYLIGMQILP